jgi:hypothetical protein
MMRRSAVLRLLEYLGALGAVALPTRSKPRHRPARTAELARIDPHNLAMLAGQGTYPLEVASSTRTPRPLP